MEQPPGRSCWLLVLIWLCFLVRGLFYCSFLPLWEGYDEWAHFAYIQRLVTGDKLLVDRNEAVSAEVSRSLQLAPVPWELRGMAGSVTDDLWWRLRPDERAAREQQLGAIPQSASRRPSAEGPSIYEALQPPLYYWLLSIPYRLTADAPLTTRVFLLRYLSLLVASFSIPLVFLAARRVEGNALFAAGVAAVVAAMPELMPDVCRVGNECLGIVVFCWLTILCLDIGRGRALWTTAIWSGIALGLGLLTKAYFLAAVPALALIYWIGFRRTLRRAAAFCGISFATAAAIGGWWYVRNRLTTGTWSGLSEAVMLAHDSPRQFLTALKQVPWMRAIDSILLSHVWFGGWSSLGVRSWMYHFFFILAGLAAAGVALSCLGVGLRRSPETHRADLYTLSAIYGCFWAGQLYNVLLLFMSKGGATSMGWYMYAVAAAETILLAVGLRAICPERARGTVFPLLVACLGALDLYSMNFVSIPYYTGLIAHRPDGSLAAFHVVGAPGWIGLHEVFGRLGVNKPAWLSGGMLELEWLCDIFAVAALFAVSIGISGAWIGRGAGLDVRRAISK